jgi:hypothetical protein
MTDDSKSQDSDVSAQQTAHDDIDTLIDLAVRQDALYREWGRIISELHKQESLSLDIEKQEDDIVRAFACMRGTVAAEIGRRMLRERASA